MRFYHRNKTYTHAHSDEIWTFAKLRHHISLLLFTPIIRMIECAERGNGGGGDSKRIDFNFSTSTSRSALNESETKLNEEEIAG